MIEINCLPVKDLCFHCLKWWHLSKKMWSLLPQHCNFTIAEKSQMTRQGNLGWLCDDCDPLEEWLFMVDL